MFISVPQFMSDILPGLLSDHERLRVLFASYREIGDRPNGSVTSSSGKKIITVLAGVRYYSIMSKLDILSVDGNPPLLAVVYLGFQQFDESLQLVRALRRREPEAVIVTLTCDCDVRIKEAKIAPLEESGSIHCSILTDRCGGSDVMEDFLQAVVSG